MGNQKDYIPNSRSSRRAHRGMYRFADIYKLEVEPRWKEFPQFLLDMGMRPDGAVLTRRDESKGFTPSNCSWQTLPVVPEPSR